MYVYRVLVVFIIFMSSVKAEFQNEIRSRWTSAVSLKFSENISFGEPLKGPLETWFNFAEIYFIDNQFRLHKDCLFYYTSKEKGKSKFSYVLGSIKEKCLTSLIEKESLKDIYKMGLDLKNSKLILTIDAKDYLVELRNFPRKDTYNLNDHSSIKPLFSSYESDRGERLKEGDTCFNTNDECSVTQPDLCQFCPSGVREIKANSCTKQYKKICSRKNCGGRGEYACLRGHYLFSDLRSYCITDSPIGFCKKPYRVFCEQGVLICR